MFSRYSTASAATRSVKRRNWSDEISIGFIRASVAVRGKHGVLGRGHWCGALLILPEHSIQALRACSVGTREIDFQGDLCPRRFPLVGFVDKAIFQIAVVRFVKRLIAGSGK